MTLFVGFSVEGEWLFAVRLVGDDGLGSALFEPLPQRGAVVSFVAEKLPGRLGAADQALGGRTIMGLAAAQKDGKKTTFSICDYVDFRISPASRVINSLLLLPLFAPEGCSSSWGTASIPPIPTSSASSTPPTRRSRRTTLPRWRSGASSPTAAACRRSEVYTDQLKRAVEAQHGGTATLILSVPIRETFERETVWEGVVHVSQGHARLCLVVAA